MKVKELVERLTDYDDDCEVFFPDCAPVVECFGHYNKITKKTEVFLTDYDENEGE